MKKLATLLLLFTFFISKSSTAQDSCNAEFNIFYQTVNTVQFTPVMPGSTGTTNIQHYWLFGDGNVANVVAPQHVYTSPGIYTAEHILIRHNPNGVEICRDSAFMVIQIGTSPTPCTLVANFYFYLDSSAGAPPHTYHFVNTSTPLNNTDSIRWTFGDGTSSNQVNPTHTYTTVGPNTISFGACLRVQKRDSTGALTNCVGEICHTVVVQNPTPCNLAANFYAYPDSTSTVPYNWHFQNTTTPLNNTDSIRWTFGDGTSSSQINPNHIYANPGTYTVCLRIQKRDSTGALTNCVGEVCHVIIVQQTSIPCNLVANFYAYPDSISTVPFNWHFQNTSAPLNNTDSIRWTFGDGTSSSQVNPNHIYANPGTYTVCLRVQKRDSTGMLTNCVSEICHVIIVQQTQIPCNLTANFYSYPDSTQVPYTYHFENTSTGLSATDSIRWTFGDGTSSNQLSPNHTYTAAGTYNVCLRIQKRNSNGTLSTCVREICHTIVVQASQLCNIPVHFTWAPEPQNPRIIHFNNLTVSPTVAATVLWTFGDGTSATTWNAVHEYANAGTYYACLRMEFGPNCVKTICDTVVVVAPTVNCTQQSNFSFVKAAANSHLYYFTPNTINSTWQYTWTFGDGTGSQSPTTSHTYANAGTYTACLTVYRNANCASTTCKTINVTNQVNCDSIHVTYSYYTNQSVPNQLYFYPISNMPVVTQTWTIQKLPSSSTTPLITIQQNNPSYIFQDTGYYHVCLRAVTLGGCIKEYCQVIHIAQVVPTNTCSLQPYPNPGTNTVSVNVPLSIPQMIDVYIYNSMNVLVKEKHQQGFSGGNTVTIPIGDLVAGIYTMKVVHGNDVCYAQFVKL